MAYLDSTKGSILRLSSIAWLGVGGGEAAPCLWEPWPLLSLVLASGSSQPGHILPCVSCPVGLGQLLPTQGSLSEALSSLASPELQLPRCPGASAELLLAPSLHLVLEAISGRDPGSCRAPWCMPHLPWDPCSSLPDVQHLDHCCFTYFVPSFSCFRRD